jgi:transposase
VADGYAHHRLRCGGALETGGSWSRDAERRARQDYRLAAANKDETAKAIAEIAKTGAEIPTLPGDILMFHRLPVSSQRAILDSAPEDEARRYALYVNRALWADPAYMRSHMCLFKKPLAEAAPAH